MDELELSVRCSRGDRSAYKELYETYSELLMAVCLRYSGDKEIANDLLHDSFVKIFGNINTFQYRASGSLRAWLTRVTINMALQHLRKTKTLDYVDDMERYEQTENDVDENSLFSIPKETILGFIMELPDATRTVLNLYMFEDMTHAEISKTLGINETASRMRLSRARTILSEKIKRYVYE